MVNLIGKAERWGGVFRCGALRNDYLLLYRDCPKVNKISSDTDAADHDPPTYSWEIEAQDILVVPSISFSPTELSTLKGFLHYEERALYALFALTVPTTRLAFVTTMPLDEWILKYHFSLLPSVGDIDPMEAYKQRVHFYSVGDPSPERSLTEKILAHPRLLDRLKRDQDPTDSTNESKRQRVLMVFRSTEHEEKMANILKLPYYSARPEQGFYGTKPGSRSIFRALGISCADGTYEAEKDLKVLEKSIWTVLRRNPTAAKGIVKLSDGFSGMGNAIMDVEAIQKRLSSLADEEVCSDAILKKITRKALENMTFNCHTWKNFQEELKNMGAIFEIFIDSTAQNEDCRQEIDKLIITSPSVQAVVNEDGSVTVLSTHEQILDKQVYHGCEFPCRQDYRRQLIEYGHKIGTFLSQHGVKDRFGVDFLCLSRSDGNWDIFAVEINLRLTGTTHPWMTLKLLTHGYSDPNSGEFFTPTGQEKCYVSSDYISDESLKRLVPQDLYELMNARKDLHWSSERQTGVVFHMLGRMPECGTVSMTAIGNSLGDARDLFDKTYEYLLSEARRDLQI